MRIPYVLLPLAVSLLSCASAGSSNEEGVAAPKEQGTVRYGYVRVEGRDWMAVELADTPAKRARGFMFRRVEPGEAMLFPFTISGIHSIWMKNCLVPLDVIWIGEDGTVVHIEENLPICEPDRPCPGYRPLQEARFVLELAAHQARQQGIDLGTHLEMEISEDN